MRLLGWTAPGGHDELALHLGPADASTRLLVLPAWFDEASALRHFTVEMMRRLADRGVASVLCDLPGCNESLQPLAAQDLALWQLAAREAAVQADATHVLTVRAGAALAPDLPGWAYAPLAPKAALRRLLRAQSMAAKEAGQATSSDDLLARGRADGVTLAGWDLGPAMIESLWAADLAASSLSEIAQERLGGPGLWLRAEPEHDPAQAQALADLIAADLPT